jgi:glycosyltransferase involved in cell wall biosynthesis
MILDVLGVLGLTLAVAPAVMIGINLLLYRTPPVPEGEPPPRVSILIPARDEEPRIARAVEAAAASRGVEPEVVVMDDHSTDRTAEIVRAIAASNPRVRIEAAPELPAGWSGKQHACHVLASRAATSRLVFIDADVELAPDGVARALGFLESSGADLVSGFPRQVTGTLVEKLVIPLIHFVLLGYLPILGTRRSPSEAFAAGCGQLFVARREAYEGAGGHAAIRATFHDGLLLPRAFRRAGFRTDLFDATRVASCRMYRGAREVIQGLAKNAHEGMAGPLAIWLWSALLLAGYVLPPALVVLGAVTTARGTWWDLALAATGIALATRVVLAIRFRQSIIGALLHPIGIATLLAIQWYAWFLRLAGRGVEWKDRAQAHG